MEASLLRGRLQPLISTRHLALGLLLALLAASTLYHELYTPSSNLHLAAERLLGRVTTYWMSAYLRLREACDPDASLNPNPSPSPSPSPSHLPAVCHAPLDFAEYISRVLARLTSFYCWHVSPTPYTCFAHIGFRETVRYACAGHEVLERIILTGAKPFLYVFVLGRYL